MGHPDRDHREALTLDLCAGQIVLAGWRDALPREANKRRPAVVVEDRALFDLTYDNALLVPLTEDARLAISDLSVAIEPSAENGCPKRCFAVAHLVTATSKERIRPTTSRITAGQLAEIRERIALCVGIA